MREDSWGDKVLGRLSSINDLVAEEAVYHKYCYLTFVKPISFPTPKAQIARDNHATQAMEEIFAHFEGY